MTPATGKPEWACPEWGPDHNWHECLDCLEEYELIIEKAQEWADEPTESEPVYEEVAH